MSPFLCVSVIVWNWGILHRVISSSLETRLTTWIWTSYSQGTRSSGRERRRGSCSLASKNTEEINRVCNGWFSPDVLTVLERTFLLEPEKIERITLSLKRIDFF